MIETNSYSPLNQFAITCEERAAWLSLEIAIESLCLLVAILIANL
jgi:hypothetical protein